MSRFSDQILMVSQAPAPPAQPPSHYDVSVPELLTMSANYLAQLQAEIQNLAVIIAIVTVLAALIGVVFTAAGFLTQYRALSEAKQLRVEIKKEIVDLHDLNKRDIDLLKTKALFDLQDRMTSKFEKRVEQIDLSYSKEIIERIQETEAGHASNLGRLESILMTYQNECFIHLGDSVRVFDFTVYNTFRHLLTHLVCGGRDDTYTALARIRAEYAEKIEQSTADLLRVLMTEISDNTSRFSRPDQRMQAGHIISILDRRFARY